MSSKRKEMKPVRANVSAKVWVTLLQLAKFLSANFDKVDNKLDRFT